MDLLNKIEQESRKVASKVKFNLDFIPGEIAEDDLFEASNESLNISVRAPTKEAAISAAREELTGRLMGDRQLYRNLIKFLQK